MTLYDNIMIWFNEKVYSMSNKRIGSLEIKPTSLNIIRDDFDAEIPFTEIAIVRFKRYVRIEMKNGDLYRLSYANESQDRSRGMVGQLQATTNLVRRHKRIVSAINKAIVGVMG